MASRSRYSQESQSIWPGYVDVLSSLLMVVIFVLMIFTFSQFIMSYILTGQSSELETLHARIAEISRLLGLEQEKNKELGGRIAELSSQVQLLTLDRSRLEEKVTAMTAEQAADEETIQSQLLTIASLQQDIDALQTLRQQLEKEIEAAVAALGREQEVSKSLRDRSKALQARLADEQEKTLLAQADLEQRDIRIQALSALVGEQKENLENQQRLTADARAEVALLKNQLEMLQSQLAEINRALKISEAERAAQKEEIRDLGDRLNIELARQVNMLERYRSDFFGRLREIVGENPLIRIEGDRFMLQAELLFGSGTAELGDAGRNQLRQLAKVLKELIPSLPDDLQWILRVDGHTDRTPIRSSNFASNWELSTARAVSVVRYLAELGIPEEHLAATGFSKFHPIDPADTEEAYRKNRRIEIKLTSR